MEWKRGGQLLQQWLYGFMKLIIVPYFCQNIKLVLYLCSFEGSVNFSELAYDSVIRELDTDNDAT